MKLRLKARLLELLIQLIEKEKADKGNIQIYIPEKDELHVVVHHGFDEEFLNYFSVVKPFDTSTCGRAFGAKLTITVSDTETDINYTEHRKISKKAGFRSVKSVPLFDTALNPIGVISTHYKEPKLFWENREVSSVYYDISSHIVKLIECNYFQKSH